ncbi:Meiosis regulator and mRNA stability factor 1 [Nymphon striatum]|nr:Meiosis regulator and mRNA stability factor 1 [Nymphon striatum]
MNRSEKISTSRLYFSKSGAGILIAERCVMDYIIKIMKINVLKALMPPFRPSRKRYRMSYQPVGIFWDIENCQVPRGKSALALVQKLRNEFLHGYREAEFMCVCDINKERKEVIVELNLAQVTVVHIDAICKNAADEKLRQSMRRFADTYCTPAIIILISNDVNFSGDLSDLRYRRGFKVIIIHQNKPCDSLLACAHDHYNFFELTSDLPVRSLAKIIDTQKLTLEITNLPANKDSKSVKSRLKRLSDNCGGKVKLLTADMAYLSFTNEELTMRAHKRMNGEDVMGNKISVNFPKPSEIERKKEKSSRNEKNSKNLNDYNKDNESQPYNRRPSADILKQENASQNTDYSIQIPEKDTNKNKITSTISRNEETCNNVENRKFSSSNQTKEESPLKVDKHVESKDQLYRQEEILYKNETSQYDSSKGKPNNTNSRNASDESHYGPKDSKDYNNYMYSTMPYGYYHQSYDVYHNSIKYDQRMSNPSHTSYSHHRLSTDTYFTKENSHDQIPSRQSSPSAPENLENFVQLRVSNLDQNTDVHQLKKLLFNIFNEHVMVLHVAVSIQPDGSYVAYVRVASIQEAQYAISQLHRRKVGFKRILISVDNDQNVVPINVMRKVHEVAALLLDVPGRKLPLFKFRELFEKRSDFILARYQRSVSISDLYKIKDTLIIDEDGRGRMVTLHPEYRNSISPVSSCNSDEYDDLPVRTYCDIHYNPQTRGNQGWAEKDSNIHLPDVSIALKVLSTRIHSLLQSHNGSLPLNSIEWCYKSDFGPFPICKSEDLASAVPLEHLISCVQGIEIKHFPSGIKKIQWAENKNPDNRMPNPTQGNSVLAGQLVLFSKEIVDLLKTSLQCQMQFNKFIPAYHHHFGRQCRVADYGYTKLADLINAISHVVHVIGEGHKRFLTLTHRSQVKRFTADLLRVLKSQPNKQMAISEFSAAYQKIFLKEFRITNYGVCNIEDMLSEIPEGVVVVSNCEDGQILAIPRREQTPEEVDRTKQFSAEVVELIRHAPQCSMEFNKFIPAYHHHFGKQCRVADYGFNKLIELFEAIPEVVEVHGEGDDKILHLTENETLKVLSEQIVTLIKSHHKQHLPMSLSQLPAAFVNLYGYSLRPEDYRANSLQVLLSKIRHVVKASRDIIAYSFIIDGIDGPMVTIVDRGFVRELSLRVRRILMDQIDTKLLLSEFIEKYQAKYGLDVNLTVIKRDLQDVCTIEKVPCQPALYGKANITALLQSIPDVAYLRGKGPKKMLILNKETSGSPLTVMSPQKTKASGSNYNDSGKGDLMELRNANISPLDLLCQPVPSCIPSPELIPNQNTSQPLDLIRFESPSNLNESLIEEDSPEKQFLSSPLMPLESSLNKSTFYEPKDEIMKAILNGTLPHISPDKNISFTKSTCISSQTPPPSMLPHPSYLLSTSNIENLPQSLTNSQESDNHSCDDISFNEQSSENLQYILPSSQSTPSKVNGRQGKSRIAAQFTVPLQD